MSSATTNRALLSLAFRIWGAPELKFAAVGEGFSLPKAHSNVEDCATAKVECVMSGHLVALPPTCSTPLQVQGKVGTGKR